MRTLTQVDSLEELVADNLADLAMFADEGNGLAQTYYDRIAAELTPDAQLFGFGQMRVDLMTDPGDNARELYEFFWG